MAHDVFISYSHCDKAVADAICARLEQDGLRCWYAPRDIIPGAEWMPSIMKAIKAAKVMILVFTDASNESPQVLNEINAAATARTIIVPFQLTMTEPNESIDYLLSRVHWLDAIEKPQEESIAQLSERIRSIFDALSGPKDVEPDSREEEVLPLWKEKGSAEKVDRSGGGSGGKGDKGDRGEDHSSPGKKPKWPIVVAIAAAIVALVAVGILLGTKNRSGGGPAPAGDGGQVWVYSDYGDPADHFTQKARMAGADASLVHNLEEACETSPHEGKTCIRCSQVTRSGDWGGWLFLNGYTPAGGGAPRLNDGKTADQGIDLTGAEALTFWARGEKGGEAVEFFTCGYGYDEWGNATVDYPDSAPKQSLGYVTLGDQWQEYRIDLKGQDMSYIGLGFGYALSGDKSGEGENVFYLDDIRFIGSFGNPG